MSIFKSKLTKCTTYKCRVKPTRFYNSVFYCKLHFNRLNKRINNWLQKFNKLENFINKYLDGKTYKITKKLIEYHCGNLKLWYWFNNQKYAYKYNLHMMKISVLKKKWENL